MGLNLSAIYLKITRIGDFSKAAGPAWAKQILDDKEPRPRQLVILFRAPWIALVDSRNVLSRTMALELSEATEGEAVWVQVSSTMLTVSFLRAIHGETVIDKRIPDLKDVDLLPRFVDAEQEGWDFLRKAGVPPELRMLRVRDIDAKMISGNRKADMILLDRKSPGQPVGHGYFTHQIKSPRREENGPPIEFSLFKKDDNLLIDLYLVPETLEPHTADHLLNVLDQIACRKPRPEGHAYAASVTPTSKDETAVHTARKVLHERFAEFGKSRTPAFRLI